MRGLLVGTESGYSLFEAHGAPAISQGFSHRRSARDCRMSHSENAVELTPEQRQALDAGGGIVQGQSFVLMRTDLVQTGP